MLREVGWDRRMLASSVLCPSLTLQTGSPPRDQSLHPSIIFSITHTYVLTSTHEGSRPLKRATTSPTPRSGTCGLWSSMFSQCFRNSLSQELQSPVEIFLKYFASSWLFSHSSLMLVAPGSMTVQVTLLVSRRRTVHPLRLKCKEAPEHCSASR